MISEIPLSGLKPLRMELFFGLVPVLTFLKMMFRASPRFRS